MTETGKDLYQMQDEVVANCIKLGWSGPNSPVITFGDAMALLHSEVSEALEAYREYKLEDFTSEDIIGNELPKPEGVGSEFADVLIRLLDYCARYGIDLPVEYERKMRYNRTRPYRHGGKAM